MERNKEFMKKHGTSIKVALRNSKLSGNKLQLRIAFIKRDFNDEYDNEILEEIEERMKDIIKTGKDQFSEEDIDIILHQVLGLEIREYDRSHLVNLEKGEIVSVNPIPKREAKPYTFGDTTITQLGTLTYIDWSGVEDLAGLPYYRIERIGENGKISTYKVFSHINIGMMESDLDYRAAVLETLLDENNITKTNCGGYIGSIETVEEGKGLEDTVKANSRYSLVFDSTDATAVGMLRDIVKKRLEEEQKTNQQETDPRE